MINHPSHDLAAILMGNLGKPLNFPLVWTRKGAVEPLRSNWFVPRGLLAKRGTLHHCLRAQHIEWLGLMVSEGVTDNFCAKRPHTCL